MPKILDSLVNNLSKVMKERGLSQTDVAKMTGVAQAHISAYLSRKYAPGIDSIEALADGLGLSVPDLIGKGRLPAPIMRDPTEEEFVAAFIDRSRLPKEKKDALLAILLQH